MICYLVIEKSERMNVCVCVKHVSRLTNCGNNRICIARQHIIARARLDSAPSSLVADQEVAEEDGGWQSATTTITTCENQQEGQQQTMMSSNQSTTTSCQPNSEFEGQNHHHHQDLPIIDLLDDINERMQIVLKSEPLSPKIECVEDLESCLLESSLDQAGELENLNERLQRNQDSTQFSDVRFQRDNSQSNEVQRQHDSKISTRPASGETYCNYCRKHFSRAWSLQRHLADTHFYVPQALSCDQCGRSYKSRNSLVSHKSQYHAKKERKDQEGQMEIY